MRAFAFVCIAFTFACHVEQPTPPDPSGLVIVIDRSGSMQGPKLEAAKDAVIASVEAMDPGDQIGVVVFDSEASILVPRQDAGNTAAITQTVEGLKSGGGTNFVPGLEIAYDMLQATNLETRHVMLLSDGEAPTDGLDEVIGKLRQAHITISTFAVQGADEQLMQKLAKDGSGRMYRVTALAALPKTFADETRLAFK